MKMLKMIALLLCLACVFAGTGLAEAAVESSAAEPELVAVVRKASVEDGEAEISGRSGSVTVDAGDVVIITMVDTDAKKWKSSNKKVATVEKIDSNQVEVTTHKAGKADITAKTPKGKKIKIKLKVLDGSAASSVTITDESVEDGTLTVWKGARFTLETEVEPEDANPSLTWKSSNKKVLSVSKKGSIKALKVGKAKLTVSTKNGKKDSILVEVVSNKVTDINPKPTSADIAELEDDIGFWLKAVAIGGDGSMTCKVYLINGTSESIKELKNFNFTIDAGLEKYLARKTFSKIKVSCGKHSYEEFKLSFPSSNVTPGEYGAVALIGLSPEDFSLEATGGTVK